MNNQASKPHKPGADFNPVITGYVKGGSINDFDLPPLSYGKQKIDRPNRFEIDVINHIIQEQPEKIQGILREQINSIPYFERDVFKQGIYLDFDQPETPLRLDAKRATLGSVHAEIKGLSRGMDFILWVTDGYVSMLECYAYNEDIPLDLSDYTLSYPN